MMDLSFLRHLQSMRSCEDDASFQTLTLNLESFKPQYQNVILVDQRVADQDVARSLDDHIVGSDELGSKPVTNRLTRALEMIFVKLRNDDDERKEWSIILKEGLYIDPALMIFELPWPQGVSIEIAGLNDVRFLALRPESIFIPINGLNVSFRNIRLYDRRPGLHPTFICIHNHDHLMMRDVKVNSPTAWAAQWPILKHN